MTPVDPQLNQLRQNLSLIPEGRELLDFADKNNIQISMRPSYIMWGGGIGSTDLPGTPGGTIRVALNNDFPQEHLTLTLAHELRHAQQMRTLESHGGIPEPDSVRDTRAAAGLNRIMEADAFTYQGMIAVKLARAGHPEFLEKTTAGEFKGVHDFLAKHPPENFKDDQALARGIFGHMLTERLEPYSDAFFKQDLDSTLVISRHREQTGPHKPVKIPLEAMGKSEIGRLYGAELMGGVSPRALEVGLMQSIDPHDRKTIRMTERLVREAGALTHEEYKSRTQDIREHISIRKAFIKQPEQAIDDDAKKVPIVKREPIAAKTDIEKSAFVKTQARLGRSAGAADVLVNVAAGNYGAAATSAGMQAGLSKGTWEAASSLVKSIAPVAKALGQVAKRAPLVGGLVTAGYVLYEVGSDVADGKYGRAGAALAAGTAEALGNTVGFGVGDGAREIVRGGVSAVAGEQHAPQKSGLRRLGESGVEAGSKFIGKLQTDAPEKPPAPSKPVSRPPGGLSPS